MGGERRRIIGVYTKKEELEKTLGELERWAEEKEEEVLTTVGKDFKARTESEDGRVGMMHKWKEREEEGRSLKDKRIDKEGKMLVGFLEEKEVGDLQWKNEWR